CEYLLSVRFKGNFVESDLFDTIIEIEGFRLRPFVLAPCRQWISGRNPCKITALDVRGAWGRFGVPYAQLKNNTLVTC
ncbi:MAG: hypothetical protein IIY32_09810, partial [Thermoguttaceae bacterium]|nr:hypothetical protein [Thermoguttaceae bacterium]